MTQIPSVADGLLKGIATGGADQLVVGSPAWFAWLADDAARSFSFRSPEGAYTARKERRQRGGVYWIGYRTAAGRQHKVYLGKGEELMPERLAAAAAELDGRVAAGMVGDPSRTLARRRPGWAKAPLASPCWRPSCSCPGPAPTWSPGPSCWPASTSASTRAGARFSRRRPVPARPACLPPGSPTWTARWPGSPWTSAIRRRAGSSLPGRRPADDRSRLRPRGAGLARRSAATATGGGGHGPGQRPGGPAHAQCPGPGGLPPGTRPGHRF